MCTPPLLWDHGNCASSVAFRALPAALQEEACSNDLLLSSLAIIALTINSRLAFSSCGGSGGGGKGWGGSLIRAPCNVSGSSSHPATRALPLLLPCLFYRRFPCLAPWLTPTAKSEPGRCFLSIRDPGNTWMHISKVGHGREYFSRLSQVHLTPALGAGSQQTPIMEMPNALSHYNTFKTSADIWSGGWH